VRVGTQAGKKVRAVLTAMDAPLGEAVGNASETREALEVLLGRGPRDLVECTLVLGAEMLQMAGKAKDEADARAQLQQAIDSGKATETMARMIAAQGGDAAVATSPEKLAIASERVAITARQSGFVTVADAREIGLSAVALGAGRTRADQPVDPAVGIRVHKKPGDRVTSGDLLAELEVHRGADVSDIADRVAAAFVIGDAAPRLEPLVVARTPV
jgi:thymidine phosphorylase